MKISDILTEDLIEVNLPVTDKEDSINKMIDIAERSGKFIDKDEVKKSVFEREKLVSTGVGKGFAIPHSKTDSVSDVVAAFATLKEPIDFDSIDNEPVKFIFLLVGRDSLLNVHIKLLSRISRLMNNDAFREKLQKATSKEEILNLFKEEEKSYIDL
ncbi:MAG: PTS sugar transporter subunit IIA [Ignavibacteria bacterium]|nr:PTS sugar transporter subunit IIA [Ignavibacteria bacterium]